MSLILKRMGEPPYNPTTENGSSIIVNDAINADFINLTVDCETDEIDVANSNKEMIDWNQMVDIDHGDVKEVNADDVSQIPNDLLTQSSEETNVSIDKIYGKTVVLNQLVNSSHNGTVNANTTSVVPADIVQVPDTETNLSINRIYGKTIVWNQLVPTTAPIITPGSTGAPTWAQIRADVAAGNGPMKYPVGVEFVTYDNVSRTNLNWKVVDYDPVSTNGEHVLSVTGASHLMVLYMKYTYNSFQFDAPEAAIYCKQKLEAGTYTFHIGQAANKMVVGDYQFTITDDIPANSQIVFNTNSGTYGTMTIYDAPGSTTTIGSAIEFTSGNTGINIGTFNANNVTIGTDVNGILLLNSIYRILYASNNYAQSDARLWLNSNEASGHVWHAVSVFDRPASWLASRAGFMTGLPSDFLAVVSSPIIPCRTNSVSESPSVDGTTYTVNSIYNITGDKFFLPSRGEIYGNYDSNTYKAGKVFEYYSGIPDADRKKTNTGGSAQIVWLRSPLPGYSYLERYVFSSSGAVNYYTANSSHGVAAACVIS